MPSFRSLSSVAAVVTIAGLPLGWHLPAIAQITASPNSTTIVTPNQPNQLAITGGTQAGSNLFHSFGQFSLGQGQQADFQVNGSIANILGRVTGNQASVIDGMLRVSGSNANLYLMNPQGILFGPNVQLNLPAGFTATTANAIGFGSNWLSATGDADFSGNTDFSKLLGQPSQFAFTNAIGGAIVNTGNLELQPNQNLTLLGGTIVNAGKLQTPGGTITIAATAGEKLLRFTPQGGLLSLDLPLADKTTLGSGAEPLSLGNLLSQGNATDVSIVDGKVQISGANINIPATPGITLASGTMNVASDAGQGGKIQIVGDRVGLFNAKLNASGATGGGTVLVGGEFQGNGELPNAQKTVVDRNTQIQANALRQGDGGRVILWADGTTSFSGDITAQGKGSGGNGGFVEVSGKQNLNFTGQVNVDAPNGKAGTLLLDPAVITIGSATTDDAELDDGTILATDGGAANFALSSAKIRQLLNDNTDLSISATNAINFNTDGAIFASAGTGSLSLTAPTISFATLQAVAIDIGGDLSFNLSGSNPISFNRELRARGINIQSAAPLTIEQFQRITAGTGEINIQAPEMTILGDLQSSTNINLRTQSGSLSTVDASVSSLGAAVNLTSAGPMQLGSGTQINAGTQINLNAQNSLTASTVELGASGNLTIQAANTTQFFNSQIQTTGNANLTNTAGAMTLLGTDLFVNGDLTIQTPEALAISENTLPTTTPSILQIQGNTRLVGTQGLYLNALNQNTSAIRSVGNITLVSDGPIAANARLLSEGNIAFQTTAGTAASLSHTPASSNGLVSAAGDIEFGDYTGNSIKVEAGGSIRGGNINITGANTAITGTDPDIANLAANPSVILRAGLTPPNLTPNRYPTTTERHNNDNLLPGFTAPGSTTPGPATITIGNIRLSTALVPGIDTVILSAPGAITTGKINADGGNVRLQSQTGDITAAIINARTTGQGGGNVTIATDGRVRVTDTFNFSYQDPFPDFTTTATSILTGTSGFGSRFLPGAVKIRSGASQFIEAYGATIPATNVSGSAGAILRANGNNASLIPAFQNQIFLSGSGNLDTPPTNSGTGGTGGTGGQPQAQTVAGVQTPRSVEPQTESDNASNCEFDPTIDATDDSCKAGAVDQGNLLKLLE